jgi:Transposase DDE domain group 1
MVDATPFLPGLSAVRMLMIAPGYEDGNDADTLRSDPMFKLALDRLPSGEQLCSQSTISRLENLPDLRAVLRLGRALVEQYCGSFQSVPKRRHQPRRRPRQASL